MGILRNVLLVVTHLLLLIPLNAQHLKVMGVSLGMNMDDTVLAFKNKGYSGHEGSEDVVIRNYGNDCWVNLRGPFWRMENTLIMLKSDNQGKTVSSIAIEIAPGINNQNLKELAKSLDAKYGNHTTIRETVGPSTWIKEYVWNVSGGEINLSFITKILSYTDSSVIAREKEIRQEQDLDL